MYRLLLILFLLAAGSFLLYYIRRTSTKRGNSKVVKLSSKRLKQSQGSRQACSFCKKKVIRLSFYANEHGQVIGVCDSCKPQAERRELMRL